MIDFDQPDHADRLVNIEAEQSLLGGLLIEPDRLHDLADLDGSHFHHEGHKAIFHAIQRMLELRQPIDVMTVAADLEARSLLKVAGGLQYIGSLYQNTPSAANVRRYAAIVVERSIERAMLAASQEIAELATERAGRTLAERQAEAIRLLGEVADTAAGGDDPAREAGEAVAAAIKAIQSRIDRAGQIGGLPTGIGTLDEMIDGLHAGELIVVGGRTSMGKSVLAVQVAAAVASAGKSVRYQSLEMPSEDLMLRAIAAKSGINLTALRSGKLEQEDYDRLTPASAWAHRLKWLTDERAGVSVEQVCASSRRQKRRSGLDLLVVDHLHLMRVKGENRAAGLGQITATLKALAMELAIPVLLVAQINREAAKGGAARRPQLHELKDSGSVEQDADVVILIHREGYYDEKANPGEAELIVAKQRNGAVGTVSVGWDASSVRFTNTPPNWESPSSGEKAHWSDL